MRSPCFLFGRPLGLLLAPLAAPLIFASPAEAQVVGPCCVREGETHPPDERRSERGPIFVPAEVERPDERALEASAEAPVTADAPLVDAIGIPLAPRDEERRGVSEPAFVPVPIFAAETPPQQEPSFDINVASCCQTRGIEPGDPPPFFVGAKVKNPDERQLAEKVEVAIRTQALLAAAIAIPMDERPAATESAREPVVAAERAPRQGAEIDGPPCCTARDREQPSPVTVDAPWSWLRAMQANAEVIISMLAFLLVIGFWLRTRRRNTQMEFERLPDELPRPNAAPVPQPEPEVASARAKGRELEPA